MRRIQPAGPGRTQARGRSGGCGKVRGWLMSSLADRVLAGDLRAIARAISVIEDEERATDALVKALFPRSGRAYIVGVTGPPGAGKSTLVDRLTAEYRQRGSTVGIIAVDPTSPFSGGAVLGDRVRMQAHSGDRGVFIRSMATRGQLGGLSRGAADAAMVLDASGKDIVFIETVGVGQDEVDIVRTADVSVIVLVPGTGDDVQAMKAGIMEIGDVFVINKADHEGSDRTVASIEAMLSLQTFATDQWKPPVLRTVATADTGIGEVVDRLDAYRSRSRGAWQARRRSQAHGRLQEILARRFVQFVEHDLLAPADWEAYTDRIAGRELDYYSAASDILARVLGPSRR